VPKLTLTEEAELDLKDIGRHTNKMWGRNQRITYLNELDDIFKKLAYNPRLGKDYSHVLDGCLRYIYILYSHGLLLRDIMRNRSHKDTSPIHGYRWSLVGCVNIPLNALPQGHWIGLLRSLSQTRLIAHFNSTR